MSEVSVFLADGFEEIEGLTVVDLMRRAGIDVETVSIMEKKKVMGSHKIVVKADVKFEKADFSETKMIVLPGGLTGTENLKAHEGLERLIRKFHAAVTDGTITTGRGMGASIAFALQLIKVLRDQEIADTIAEKIVYQMG